MSRPDAPLKHSSNKTGRTRKAPIVLSGSSIVPKVTGNPTAHIAATQASGSRPTTDHTLTAQRA